MEKVFLFITLSSFSNSQDALAEFPYGDGQGIIKDTMKGGNPIVTIDLVGCSMTDEQELFLSKNPKVLFFHDTSAGTIFA